MGKIRIGAGGKRIIILLVAIAIGTAWGISFYHTNISVEQIPEKFYQLSENVEMESNILENDLMTGYSIKVTEAEIMSYNAYIEKYGLDGGQIDSEIRPEKVYDITLTVSNKDNQNTGIDFTFMRIQERDVFLDSSGELFALLYPELEGSTSVALRENTSVEFHVPFNIRRKWFNSKSWADLTGMQWKLVLTKYPEKRCVVL